MTPRTFIGHDGARWTAVPSADTTRFFLVSQTGENITITGTAPLDAISTERLYDLVRIHHLREAREREEVEGDEPATLERDRRGRVKDEGPARWRRERE